jgi:signal transduction histidine kinase
VLCLDNDLDALVRYDKVSAGGVGLSITRQIMQSHGGFVTVRSSPGGGGSVFTLRFQ